MAEKGTGTFILIGGAAVGAAAYWSHLKNSCEPADNTFPCSLVSAGVPTGSAPAGGSPGSSGGGSGSPAPAGGSSAPSTGAPPPAPSTLTGAQITALQADPSPLTALYATGATKGLSPAQSLTGSYSSAAVSQLIAAGLVPATYTAPRTIRSQLVAAIGGEGRTTDIDHWLWLLQNKVSPPFVVPSSLADSVKAIAGPGASGTGTPYYITNGAVPYTADQFLAAYNQAAGVSLQGLGFLPTDEFPLIPASLINGYAPYYGYEPCGYGMGDLAGGGACYSWRQNEPYELPGCGAQAQQSAECTPTQSWFWLLAAAVGTAVLAARQRKG